MLVALPHPLFLVDFHSFPHLLLSSSVLFALQIHTPIERTFQGPCICSAIKSSRREANVALDAAWRGGGPVWDLFHRTNASSPKESY